MKQVPAGWTVISDRESHCAEMATTVLRVDDGKTLYHMEVESTSDVLIKRYIEVAIEQAITLLHENIVDQSVFFMCGWHPQTSTLRIAVTDDTKKNESPHCVQVIFSGLQREWQNIATESLDRYQERQEHYTDQVRYWLRDYLTTSNGFMRYSLVSAFYDSTPQASSLL